MESIVRITNLPPSPLSSNATTNRKQHNKLQRRHLRRRPLPPPLQSNHVHLPRLLPPPLHPHSRRPHRPLRRQHPRPSRPRHLRPPPPPTGRPLVPHQRLRRPRQTLPPGLLQTSPGQLRRHNPALRPLPRLPGPLHLVLARRGVKAPQPQAFDRVVVGRGCGGAGAAAVGDGAGDAAGDARDDGRAEESDDAEDDGV